MSLETESHTAPVRQSTAAWWGAAVLALVALVALVLLFATADRSQPLQAANEPAPVAESVETAAARITDVTIGGPDRAAVATEQVAAAASEAAVETAEATQDAAANVSDAAQIAATTEPAQPQE